MEIWDMAGEMRAGRRVRLAATPVLVALLLVVGLPGRASPPVAVRPEARQAPAAGGEVEVLVVLKAQADLAAVSGGPAAPGKAARGRAVYEALRATATQSQRELLAFLAARGADYHPFYLVNAVWVRAGEDLLRELARRPDVASIAANPHVRGVDLVPAPASAPVAAPAQIQSNLTRIQTTAAWALGYNGQGIVVAGADTGIAWQHPALVSKYRGWDGLAADHDYHWHDAIHSGGGTCGADSPEPCDDYLTSHGTHTMGIMVGSEELLWVGVAPGAQWIGCRNMDQGVGTPATYIECFEFFLAPYPLGGSPEQGNPALAPHVVNNSWGCPPSEGCDAAAIALLEQSVEALRQAGIVVVASAGNSGALGCGSVADPPAIYPGSFTVGNFDHRSDTIAPSSSRGPVTYGGQTYVKPDIAAPGTAIVSSIKDGGYGISSGTSMAAPHVAGAVAVLLSAAPGLAGDVEAVEELLTLTAEPMLSTLCGDAGPPNNVWGWGIPDLWRTVNAGLVRGSAVAAGSGLPLAGAQVLAVGHPPLDVRVETATGLSGSYSLALWPGVYDVTVDGPCHEASTVVVEVARSSITTAEQVALRLSLCTYLPLVLN